MADTELDAVDNVPEEAADERRELLESQFAEIETTEPQADTGATERARAADGKFAAKEVGTAPTGGIGDPEEPLWSRPPKSWKKEYHEVWNAADPRLREYAYQREEEKENGLESARTRAVAYDHIAKVMEPYMPTINGLGLEPAAAIKGLMEADHILRTSPAEQKRAYLMQLANHYGITLGDVSGHVAEGGAQHPDLYALKNELNQVRGEVVGWKRAQEEAENQTLLQDIANFAKNVEHFEEVRPSMAKLLQAGLAETLEDAYTQAIRLNEELFTAGQTASQERIAAQKRDTANRAAKAARGAAVSVRGSTPGAQAKTNAQDRRTMLAEQFDSVTDRL